MAKAKKESPAKEKAEHGKGKMAKIDIMLMKAMPGIGMKGSGAKMAKKSAPKSSKKSGLGKKPY